MKCSDKYNRIRYVGILLGLGFASDGRVARKLWRNSFIAFHLITAARLKLEKSTRISAESVCWRINKNQELSCYGREAIRLRRHGSISLFDCILYHRMECLYKLEHRKDTLTCHVRARIGFWRWTREEDTKICILRYPKSYRIYISEQLKLFGRRNKERLCWLGVRNPGLDSDIVEVRYSYNVVDQFSSPVRTEILHHALRYYYEQKRGEAMVTYQTRFVRWEIWVRKG